jgi:hypothetical protein
MTDAFVIAVVATGIVAVIVGVVTWMLVLPARRAPRDTRVLAVGEPPLQRAMMLAERKGAAKEQAARRSGTEAARRSGTEAARRSGAEAARRSGTEAARRSGTEATVCGGSSLAEPTRLLEEFGRHWQEARWTAARAGEDAGARALEDRPRADADAADEPGAAGDAVQGSAVRARRLAQVLMRLARPGDPVGCRGPVDSGGPGGSGGPAGDLARKKGTGAPVVPSAPEPTPAVRQAAARPVGEPAPYRRIDDQHWYAHLASPALEPSLTGLMAMLGPEVVTWHAYAAERYGLARQERVESLTAPPRIAELAEPVARAVGVSPPVLFVTPERDARLVHINLAVAGRYQAALAVGGQALAFEDEARMRFMLGRKLTFMRAEHLVCTCVDGPEDLRALHLAASRVLDPGSLDEPPERVAGLLREEALQRLREHFGQADRAGAARRLLRLAAEGAPDPADPAAVDRWERWQVAAAQTSFRCGLLLSGDLEATLSILDQDDLIPGTDWEHRDCYPELYQFFLSEDFRVLHRVLTARTHGPA